MFCVACGGDVPAGSRFCPRCGRATSPAEGSASPADAPSSDPPPGPPTAPPPPPPPPPSYAPPPSYTPQGGGYAPQPGGYGQPGGYPPPPGAYPPQSPYGGGAAGPVAYGLASFGQRAGALIIDSFLLWVVSIALFVVAEATVPDPSFDNPSPGPSGLGAVLLVIGWFAGPVYYVLMEGRPEGQTLGKKALGIRAVRRSDGAPLGYGLAIGRTLARIVDALTLGLGLLWAAWDPMRQTFHDKIASTLVVRSSVYPPPVGTGSGPSTYQPAPPPNPYQTG